MNGLSMPLKLILSLFVGAAIGLEREWHRPTKEEQKTRIVDASVGVRTFSLISLLGTVVGFLEKDHFGLFLTVTIAVMILIISYYIILSVFTKDIGVTTEIAVIFCYLIGTLVALETIPIQIVLAITVVLMLILSRKEKIKTVVSSIRREEINAFISYAIIALVILPFLPNRAYSLVNIPGLETFFSQLDLHLGGLLNIEIINPFRLWLIVALITGVDMAGFVLSKTIGQKKGWLLTSVIGGFVSSTATTQSLAQRSKKSRAINYLVAAAIFANLASFIQCFILIVPINSVFLIKSLPLIFFMIISALIIGIIFLKLKKPSRDDQFEDTQKQLEEKEIFSLGPALKFALLFLVIKLVTKISLLFLGSRGFIFTSALASITGVDAVTINTAELVGKTIIWQTGVVVLLLVNAVNLISKSIYSFAQGKKEFALKFSLSSTVIILSGLLGVVICW